MNTEEQRQDIIENCTILLEGILKPFAPIDDTPEGRMITQLNWLKERAENHDLPLPVERGKLASLLYIYVNGEITHLASIPDDRKIVHKEIEIYLGRLYGTTKKGRLLAKHRFYPCAVQSIDALLLLLRNSPRPLDEYEKGFITELTQLKQLLAQGKIEPPLGAYMPDYPNFIKARFSIEDIPNGKEFFKIVSDFIFNGTRPDNWLTPEGADKDTQNLI